MLVGHKEQNKSLECEQKRHSTLFVLSDNIKKNSTDYGFN